MGPEIVDEDVIGTSVAGVLGVMNTEEPLAPTTNAPSGVLEVAEVTFAGSTVGTEAGDVALAGDVVKLATRLVPT